MASSISFSILVMTVTTVYGQMYGNYRPRMKSGSCAPPLLVDVCTKSCNWDNQCLGLQKCCPTSCGGTVCSRPVTTKNPEKIGAIKPGVCPNASTGQWICSSTCVDDSDCPETKKCCKTRCGGFTCKKPPNSDGIPAPNNEIDVYSNSIPVDNGNNNNNNNFNPDYIPNYNSNYNPNNNPDYNPNYSPSRNPNYNPNYNANNNFNPEVGPAYHANPRNPFLNI